MSQSRLAIPAYCSNCDLVFKSRMTALPISTSSMPGPRVILSGNTEPCPRCRGRADTFEGEFRSNENLLEVISAPQWSVDILKKLEHLLERGNTPNANREELIEEIQILAPEAASYLKPFTNSRKAWTIASGFLLFALSQCEMKINVTVDLDANKLFEQYLEHSAESSIPPKTAEERTEGEP